MRVLLDTNIVLDVLLKREPWAADARAIWQANDQGRITGHILASVLTDIFYIARKQAGIEAAQLRQSVIINPRSREEATACQSTTWA